MYRGLVQVPTEARSADVVVRIDITSDEYTVTSFEKKGIPIAVDVSELSNILL